MPDILKTDPRLAPSFSFKNRALRVCWGVVYWIFFRFSPRPFHAWRAFLLKLFGAKMGKSCHVYPSVKIWAPWNLEMDDFAGLGDHVDCYSMAKISLGRKTLVSQGVFLCTGTHDYESSSFLLYAKPIVIGDEAWVCAESFVGPGVTIGQGAVIGARSVVVKDMPAWRVCAGNPCAPLKPREIKK
jgi:putative colanic acid biosynthesis acetyltransferase WcaF